MVAGVRAPTALQYRFAIPLCNVEILRYRDDSVGKVVWISVVKTERRGTRVILLVSTISAALALCGSGSVQQLSQAAAATAAIAIAAIAIAAIATAATFVAWIRYQLLLLLLKLRIIFLRPLFCRLPPLHLHPLPLASVMTLVPDITITSLAPLLWAR
jgi:hypothetical protein